MVSRLDSNDFKLRAAAEEQLAAWGELAEPNLRSALFRHSSPELRLRATRLLEKFDKPVTDPEILRTIRVVEVLDHIGTPEARDLLKTLAGGAPPARLTREAKQALARLDRLSSRK